MSEKTIQDNTQFFFCDSCNATGKNEKNHPCEKCKGIGLGTFIFDYLLYWQTPISKTNIYLRKLKINIFTILDIFSWLIFIAGLSSLGYFFTILPEITTFNLINFYNNKNFLLIFFWIGISALLFIHYRNNRKKQAQLKITKLKIKNNFNTPNNWEELIKYKKAINTSNAIEGKTLQALENAYLLALKMKHQEVSMIHLFYTMLNLKEIIALLTRLNVNITSLKDKLNHQLSKTESSLKKETDLQISKDLKEILILGFIESYSLNKKHITSLNLILNCIKKDKIINEILLDLKVNEDKIKNTIEWFRINEKQVANYKTYKKLAKFKPKTTMDRAYTAVATPLLNSYGYDLTLAAKWGRLDICVARDKELDNIFDSLKSGQNGILLIGQDGVGKKTIIEGIASLMVEENVPDFLKDKRLIELDIARLISGASPSEAEKRLLTIIDEINRAGNIILYIENIENIIGISSGNEGSLELSEVLSNALERRALYLFATATTVNYSKFIEETAINSILDKIIIKEPVGNQAIQIVESKIALMETKHKVFFSYNAIEASIKLSSKFIHDKYLPKKSIEILEKTAINKAAAGGGICSKNDIAKTIHKITDIPIAELSDRESEELLHLEDNIHTMMINQNEAVNVVSDSLRRARTQLREGKRPISSFLFMGPTGVGKTELAKAITKVYFKNKDYMIRLDMSEYQHEDSIVKMIGDKNSSGYLTEAVRKKPFSLILLDEFEKANPKIFNLFLQVMDDGRLTDGTGNTIDFTNSIIIATSNAGSSYIQEEVKKKTDLNNIKQSLINEHLNKVMRPELINRFDDIVVFKPLSQQNITDITKLMLKSIEKMLKEKGIFLEAEDEGIVKIAEEGYDPKFGARPLRRLIQKKVENEIAKQLLSGNIERRDTIVINKNAEIEIKKGKEL